MKLLRSSPAAECVGETWSETVHVAVGRSPEKTRRLLEWTFRQLRCQEIVLVHIHRPSLTIPTLLGNLPVDQANEVLVSAHRLEEWKNTQKLLLCYRRICYGSQVQPKVILVESEHIQKGIIDVVNKHAIRILIMGASPDKCFKVKSMFSQPIYATKNAPFCEMRFVHKGKLVFVKEAIDSSETIQTTLLRNQSTVSIPDTEYDRSKELERLGEGSLSQFFNDGETSLCKDKSPPKANPKVTSSEASKMREIKLIEDRILATKLEQIELMNQKKEITKEHQSVTKNLAILHDCVREITHHQEEATAQFDSIMSSIAALKFENQKIQHERDEYVQQIGRLRRKNHRKFKICNKFIGLGSDSLDLKEFLLSELETATFGFSDKFLIGQVGHGCVYKGEMMNRSVAIKKFHHHSVQGQREFQKEVFVLSKLRHPNLLTPIGSCSVASSLVYEFLPNGNLHNRITCKTLLAPIVWMNRVQIIAEISCALLFLHSSKPELIVHGDLKPVNIFLDSNLSCRIGGFGFCELVADQNAARHPLLRQTSVPKNLCEAHPYTDPEYQRTGILTSKSDIYSLGMIALQLLTGRSPHRLVNEVQRAVLSHRLSDLLDITAGEWPKNVSEKLAEFGLKCTEIRGCNRPKLTPAAVRELELLHPKQERPVPTSFLCPILKEIMNEPVVAMDGFTYEGTAIQEWLENSRETSPMTNLELENLNLFPNHALKLAIQDWLSQAFQD